MLGYDKAQEILKNINEKKKSRIIWIFKIKKLSGPIIGLKNKNCKCLVKTII
jgi:hypothetical protein